MMHRKAPVRSRMAHRNKGFTLTEIAIVLGIIGLILGAIWVAAASVYNAQRLNHATTATLQIAQGIRSLYATSSTTGYTAATDITQAMITANVIPNDLVNSAKSFTIGPFTGGYTQVSATADGNGFVLAMSGLTQAACINLLTAIGGTSRDPGLYLAGADTTAISQNTPAGKGTTAVTSALTTAVTPLIAAAAYGATVATEGGCTSATGGQTVYFGFSLK